MLPTLVFKIRQIQNLSHQYEFESHEQFFLLQTATRIRGQAELLGSSIGNVVLLLCSHDGLWINSSNMWNTSCLGFFFSVSVLFCWGFFLRNYLLFRKDFCTVGMFRKETLSLHSWFSLKRQIYLHQRVRHHRVRLMESHIGVRQSDRAHPYLQSPLSGHHLQYLPWTLTFDLATSVPISQVYKPASVFSRSWIRRHRVFPDCICSYLLLEVSFTPSFFQTGLTFSLETSHSSLITPRSSPKTSSKDFMKTAGFSED